MLWYMQFHCYFITEYEADNSHYTLECHRTPNVSPLPLPVIIVMMWYKMSWENSGDGGQWLTHLYFIHNKLHSVSGLNSQGSKLKLVTLECWLTVTLCDANTHTETIMFTQLYINMFTLTSIACPAVDDKLSKKKKNYLKHPKAMELALKES